MSRASEGGEGYRQTIILTIVCRRTWPYIVNNYNQFLSLTIGLCLVPYQECPADAIRTHSIIFVNIEELFKERKGYNYSGSATPNLPQSCRRQSRSVHSPCPQKTPPSTPHQQMDWGGGGGGQGRERRREGGMEGGRKSKGEKERERKRNRGGS